MTFWVPREKHLEAHPGFAFFWGGQVFISLTCKMVHKHDTRASALWERGTCPGLLGPEDLDFSVHQEGKERWVHFPASPEGNQFHSLRPPPRALVKQVMYFILLGGKGIGLVSTITGRWKRFRKVPAWIRTQDGADDIRSM